ncbi:MAG: acyl-CoA thioesterase [Pseudomonadota bacterium]
MAKPSLYRLNPASYPFSAITQTRFGDMDFLGHLNNVAYAALFENGRVRFNRSLDERRLRLKGERWLVAAVEINYLREGHFPDDVLIASGVGRINTSSWVIEQGAFQGGVCIATCDTVLVYQGIGGAAKPLADGYRAELEKLRIVTG